MANLIVDIGNTALKAAWAEESTLGKTFRYQGERIINFILSLTFKVKPEVLIISTAVELSESNKEKLKKECKQLIVLDSNSSLYSDYNLPTYLSPDRFAIIVATRNLFKDKACTIFDFGTTMSIDFLASDGSYEGGNVTLGCRTRFKAISRYSKTLPLINTPDEILDKGNSITSSIESGIMLGIMFDINGYLEKNKKNIIIFTGGDAIYFAKRIKNSTFVVCNLVLMGLAIIADNYEKNI